VRNAAKREIKIGKENRNMLKKNRIIQNSTKISISLGSKGRDKYNCPEKKHFILSAVSRQAV
jgi:hypothetical protein